MSSSALLIDPPGVLQDVAPLAWVSDELRKSLDGAAKTVRRFARELETEDVTQAEHDANPLRTARQQLHQAAGVMEMVRMAAPATLVRAMARLVEVFVQRPQACTDAAARCVETAAFAVIEYLQGVLRGGGTSSVALFPQFRMVMELAGSDRIHPADLWTLEWQWKEVPLPASALPLRYSPELRSRMDRAVLNTIKSADSESARQMVLMCASLSCGQSALEPRTFWAVAAGFFEAMAIGVLAHDTHTKRAASRVLQQYAALSKDAASPSDQLARDLVFFCAMCNVRLGQAAPMLQAVRRSYGLMRSKAVDYNRERLGRFDPALLLMVRKRIATAADSWSALAGGDTSRVRQVADQFAAMTESVQSMHADSEVLLTALGDAVALTTQAGSVPSAAIAMEVATAVLYLEALHDELDFDLLGQRGGALAQRLQRACAGGEPDALEPWMEDLYRRVGERQTMGTVVSELRATLAQVEAVLDQFFRRPADPTRLRDVPGRLAQMRGVFSVLGLEQPALAALRMRNLVEQFISEGAPNPPQRTEVFERLGNSVGAMGFLIDMLSYQRSLARQFFVYDEAAGEFRPTMGQSPKSEHGAPSQATPIADTEDDDLKGVFLDEARAVIQGGLAALNSLALEPDNLADQTTVRRAFHTLKGSARMVGLDPFGEAAWSFEQLFNSWLAEPRQVSGDMIALAAQALEALGRWAQDCASGADVHWDPAAFRASADAMRFGHLLVPLSLPGTSQQEAQSLPAPARSPRPGCHSIECDKPLARPTAHPAHRRFFPCHRI
jgi:chemosensory pili system protein ChpA (sensor histidine kinase/response regulator)